jgi:hypothetical protein
MTIGPRETAHREYRDAVTARTAALKVYGIGSETYKAANARLTDAISKLPEPPPKWD